MVLQIGTGFKDEDLEKHYSFLKVQLRFGAQIKLRIL